MKSGTRCPACRHRRKPGHEKRCGTPKAYSKECVKLENFDVKAWKAERERVAKEKAEAEAKLRADAEAKAKAEANGKAVEQARAVDQAQVEAENKKVEADPELEKALKERA